MLKEKIASNYEHIAGRVSSEGLIQLYVAKSLHYHAIIMILFCTLTTVRLITNACRPLARIP